MSAPLPRELAHLAAPLLGSAPESAVPGEDPGSWAFPPDDGGLEWVVRHDARGGLDPQRCVLVAEEVSSTAGDVRLIAVVDGVASDLGEPARRHAWLRDNAGDLPVGTLAWVVSAAGPPELHGLPLAVYPVEMLPGEDGQVAQLRLRRDPAGWSGELCYTFGPAAYDGTAVAVVRWDASGLSETLET